MDGVVSVLAEPFYERVETLWREMKRRFGVGFPGATAVPHFSYHIAEQYDEAHLKQLLAETAALIAPFTVQTTGAAIFSDPRPVLYIPVARSQPLAQLHQYLWPKLEAISTDSSTYYAPSQWFPHITLGHNDITAENLGAIVTWLNEQALAWTVPVNNLSWLHDEDGRHYLRYQRVFHNS